MAQEPTRLVEHLETTTATTSRAATAKACIIALILARSKAPKLDSATDEVVLTAGEASCTIKLFGATVTHYAVNAARPILFLSEKAIVDGSKPIRGGIPLVFPFFGAGDGTLPSHGFARINTWTVVKAEAASATLRLDTRDITTPWPHHAVLSYVVELTAESLKTSLRITNTGSGPFPFQALLHTYYRVPDAMRLKVGGMNACAYIDQVQAGAVHKVEDEITVSKETDWIVRGVPGSVQLWYGGGESPDVVIHRGLLLAGAPAPSECVVWNPYIEKAKRMADFGDDECAFCIVWARARAARSADHQ